MMFDSINGRAIGYRIVHMTFRCKINNYVTGWEMPYVCNVAVGQGVVCCLYPKAVNGERRTPSCLCHKFATLFLRALSTKWLPIKPLPPVTVAFITLVVFFLYRFPVSKRGR